MKTNKLSAAFLFMASMFLGACADSVECQGDAMSLQKKKQIIKELEAGYVPGLKIVVTNYDSLNLQELESHIATIHNMPNKHIAETNE